MSLAEGGGKKAVVKKFQDVYLPALKANWVLWPAVQLINFRLLPIQFQIVSITLAVGLVFNPDNHSSLSCRL